MINKGELHELLEKDDALTRLVATFERAGGTTVTVTAGDERGPGNANHLYYVRLESRDAGDAGMGMLVPVNMQKGPFGENGPNGLIDEALLAIVADRWDGFQSGPFAHPKNAEAAAHLRAALQCLDERRNERRVRGVDGTMRA